MPYKFYILIHGTYFDLLKLIGISDFNVLHSLLLNAFIGACTSVYIYKIIDLIINESKLKEFYTICVISFPLSIFYFCNLLREGILVFFLMVVIFQTLNSGSSISKRVFIILFIILCSFFVRPASAFFIAAFPASSLLFNSKEIRRKSIPVLIILIALLLFYKNDIYNRDIKDTQEMYRELSSQTSSDNSIGLKLIKSDNLIFRILSVPYIILSPIPPPIFKNFNFNSFFISIGSILWYIYLPIFFLSIKKFAKQIEFRKIIVQYMATFILSSILVTQTSADPRHLILFYPISIFFSVLYIFRYKNEFFHFLLNYTMISIICIIGYLIIKL